MRLRRTELIIGICCFISGIGLIVYDLIDNRKLPDEPEKIVFSPQARGPSAIEIVDMQKKLFADPDSLIPSKTVEAIVKQPESFIRFLKRHHVGPKDIKEIKNSLKPYYNKQQLSRGHRFYITQKHKEGQKPSLEKIVFLLPPAKKVVLTVKDGQVEVSKKPTILPKKFEYLRGTIQDSLYIDGLKAGLSRAAINSLTKQFSYIIDLQRSLRQGDAFEVLVERPFDQETGFVDPGSVVYASLNTRTGIEHIYRYAPKENDVEYFDEKGRGIRKALLKTPVRAAPRITSRFGMRKHPIQGYTIMHRGIDFAAPRGTPVVAAGNGYIKKRGDLGSYGNYILIQHNRDYATAYAHLSRFAKGQKKGTYVKQGEIIAYVGTTGRSTAPHLHYEIHYKKKQVNPQKIKMPSQRNLSGAQKQNFIAHMRMIRDHVSILKGQK